MNFISNKILSWFKKEPEELSEIQIVIKKVKKDRELLNKVRNGESIIVDGKTYKVIQYLE